MALGIVPAPSRLIYRFLDTNGDGTGAVDMIGDYSPPNETAFFTLADEPLIISLLVITMVGVAKDMEPVAYGSLPALLNGINIALRDDQGALQQGIVRGGELVRNNRILAELGFTVDYVSDTKSGVGQTTCRFLFDEGGAPLFLPLGWTLGLELNDDMAGLVHHKAIVHGFAPSERALTKISF